MPPPSSHYDAAIVGAGPAGSTCGALLRKYAPDLRVLIIEKEPFPREHVGESQLPLIGQILHEMGAWDKIEAALFPVKLGATYRWGRSSRLWDFGFIPFDEFRDDPRPAAFEGQRTRTAFQVDRARYDTILRDHAASLGCEIAQPAAVERVDHDGGRVTGLLLSDGRTITADHYVDASGVAGVLRRALAIRTDEPGNLRNIAMWDYWENAEWAVSIGSGGTRVLVLSIGCGWLWFIPISPTRTSVGFVCPAGYYRESGRTIDDLYAWAVQREPLIAELTQNATRDGRTRATKDWSFVAERTCGENWFLTGDAAGFGDPILAAGLMLTHASAREAAYTILELRRGEHDPAWLRDRYDESVRRRIRQHIRFADFWYAANGQFTDLEAHTARIAKDAGLSLSPKDAFRWLSNGGFTTDVLGRAGLGGVDFEMVMHLAGELLGGDNASWQISRFNIFRPALAGARLETIPVLSGGRIHAERCLVRADKVLPLVGIYAVMLEVLSRASHVEGIREALIAYLRGRGVSAPTDAHVMQHLQALEVMLLDGWVYGSYDKDRSRYRVARRDPTRSSVVPDTGDDRPRRF